MSGENLKDIHCCWASLLSSRRFPRLAQWAASDKPRMPARQTTTGRLPAPCPA